VPRECGEEILFLIAWQVWNRVRYIFAKPNEKNNKQATFELRCGIKKRKKVFFIE